MKNINKEILKGLNPWYVTGITDSEGSFSCYIRPNSKVVSLEYKVTQKSHSRAMLYELINYFSSGTVVIDNRVSDTYKYHVTSLPTLLEKVIPHFIKYPCLTSKELNFNDWATIAQMLSKKEHLNSENGLFKIIEIISNMNKKRSFEMKYKHCNQRIKNIHFDLPGNWVQGFLDGESTFYNYVTPLSVLQSKVNKYVNCNSSMEVAQNSHDIAVLLALKNFFNSGYIKPKYDYDHFIECLHSRSVNRFIIRDTSIIIIFINEHPLITRKNLDFLDWKEITEIKDLGLHRSISWLNKIWDIKNKMNSRRK